MRVLNEDATVWQSTLIGNKAGGSGGGVSAGGASFRMGRSILWGNLGPVNPNLHAEAGDFVLETYNLYGDLAGLPITPGDHAILLDGDLLQGELADNGGPTPTISLLPGSPAIDAIPSASCLDHEGLPMSADQRGRLRPIGAGCDIGAYEAQ